MGWERKRGKLLDFNRLIKGEYDSFPVKVGDLTLLRSVRFVLTLDTDTELPRGTAYRLIGALAHPLEPGNRRSSCKHRHRRLRDLATTRWHQRDQRGAVAIGEYLFRPDRVFDIYSRAVSDVYQDLERRGNLHRQGHLRSSDLEPGTGAPLSA